MQAMNNRLRRLIIRLCLFLPVFKQIKKRRQAELALSQRKEQIAVVLMGYTGSGKSRFARLLCQQIHAFWQNSELTSYKLFGRPHLTDQTEIHKTFQVMENELASAIHSGKSVVRDYVHNRRSQRQGVYKLVSENGNCPVLIVWIKTPESIAIRRRLSRQETPYQQRQTTTLTAKQEARTLVEEFNQDLEEPDKSEDLVVIDGLLPFKKQYKKFLNAYISLVAKRG